ncbi:hypothetical protein CEXT_89111 [Caerostris extrusa]|uniref:Uncharacterized protein n=1 Tax=Caerostris extrusa TaxID=172846 RepID=A0AAV4SUS0_CAEEX|nr:hypothetical protein CEXT_89111 [Caerostris extrusa]
MSAHIYGRKWNYDLPTRRTDDRGSCQSSPLFQISRQTRSAVNQSFTLDEHVVRGASFTRPSNVDVKHVIKKRNPPLRAVLIAPLYAGRAIRATLIGRPQKAEQFIPL